MNNRIAEPGSEASPFIAAILDDRSSDIDSFLADIVAHQVEAGLRVCGGLMQRPPRQAGCSARMV